MDRPYKILESEKNWKIRKTNQKNPKNQKTQKPQENQKNQEKQKNQEARKSQLIKHGFLRTSLK